jgi:hypothetical protein
MPIIDNMILKNKKFNISDTILIAGSPRSGTTWLLEILAATPGYTSLFEPLNHEWFPGITNIGFKSRTYLPYYANWVEGKNHMRKIFTGQVFSFTPQYRLKLDPFMHRLLGKKLIVKLVRGNRLLPWLSKNIQLHGIVLIIRHPCAVIVSQLKTGMCGYNSFTPPYSDIFPKLENILKEASNINNIDQNLLKRLKHIKTLEEILAVVWCLDNYVPLSFPKPYPWQIVTYEKLVKEGKKEIIQLFNKLGVKDVPKAALKHLKIPSTLAPIREYDIIKKSNEQLSKWKKTLSVEQIERILNIVSDFGLDFYTEDLEPDYKNI